MEQILTTASMKLMQEGILGILVVIESVIILLLLKNQIQRDREQVKRDKEQTEILVSMSGILTSVSSQISGVVTRCLDIMDRKLQ